MSTSEPLKLADLKQHITALTLKQKQALAQWLKQQIAKEQQTVDRPRSSRSLVLDSTKENDVLYRLEKRRCGKEGCHCMGGELGEVGHGPYWYAYWREDGRLKTCYIGKKLKPSKLKQKQT